MKLINKPVTRLFTFGCSFTEYFWSTWPEIIAFDLDVPLYNFGKSGAGNQYISNMIAQADSVYNFTENDLVIVCWTNVCREDRWVNGKWVTPGNIFTQSEYDQNYINKWADSVGYLIRDLSTIKLTSSLLKLKKCQYHFLSMVDIIDQIDQNNKNFLNPKYNHIIEKLKINYQPVLLEFKKSFFSSLWSNNIYNNKIKPDIDIYGKYWSDGHPSPSEHLQYLENNFEHSFNIQTKNIVNYAQKNLENFVRNISDQKKQAFAIYELSAELLNQLKEETKIKKSELINVI